MIDNLVNLIIILNLNILLIGLLYDPRKVIKILEGNLYSSYYVLIIFPIVIYTIAIGLAYIISLLLIIFITVVLSYFFFQNRMYAYITAIAFIIMIPILLILGFSSYAEYIGSTAIILIIVGILKDVLYEKLFIS